MFRFRNLWTYYTSFENVKNDLRKKQVSGFYIDTNGNGYDAGQTDLQEKKDQIDGESPGSYAVDDMAELYEVHVDLDLEGFEDIDPRTNEPTGIKLPYIVTIDRGSDSIISIYRNYNQADALRKRTNTLYIINFYQA